jgi:hypothetical protein
MKGSLVSVPARLCHDRLLFARACVDTGNNAASISPLDEGQSILRSVQPISMAAFKKRTEPRGLGFGKGSQVYADQHRSRD